MERRLELLFQHGVRSQLPVRIEMFVVHKEFRLQNVEAVKFGKQVCRGIGNRAHRVLGAHLLPPREGMMGLVELQVIHLAITGVEQGGFRKKRRRGKHRQRQRQGPGRHTTDYIGGAGSHFFSRRNSAGRSFRGAGLRTTPLPATFKDWRPGMNITISGASGLIGRRLLKALGASGHALHILSRHAGTNVPNGVRLSPWDPAKAPPRESLEAADAVVHLAGEPVAQRWTPEVKRRIRESRVEGTRRLVEALAGVSRKPAVLVCASAIGYYGDRGDELLDESAPPGSGFLPEVCVAWEREAQRAAAVGLRVALIRIGLVLDPRGGALRRMLPPFRFGIGGRLGSGQQWMSWIHIEDLVELFRFAIDQPVSGPLHGTAPEPVRNLEFTRELAAALRRPALLPVPRLALWALFGEMAGVLLESQRAVPQAAEAAGFRFRHRQLGPALADLLR